MQHSLHLLSIGARPGTDVQKHTQFPQHNSVLKEIGRFDTASPGVFPCLEDGVTEGSADGRSLLQKESIMCPCLVCVCVMYRNRQTTVQ